MLAGALALSVTPILGFTGVASAQTEADPVGPGNFCESVPQQEPFTDVQPTDPSYGEIVCLVATEITTGVTATTYEPNSFVTRRQMALFLVRLALEADRLEIGDNIATLPPAADTDFTDTEDEEQFIEDAISQITQAGVAEGFPDNTYRPAAPVSRRQMAAFIDRMYEFLTGAALPNSTTDHFADDNADSAAAQESTNAVAEAGIFIGNADGTFRPAQEITRRQMANVLTRLLQVLFENGEITKWASDATPASNQTFTLATGSETRTTDPTVAAGQRTCTVTGIPSGSVVDARVVPTEDITIGPDGRVTFLDTAAPASQFDETPAAARIVNVNGANVTPSQEVNNVTAAIGAIAVTFISTLPDDVTLLVWTDQPGLTADVLDLEVVTGTDRKAPREVFGVGCRTSFVNEAGSGPVATAPDLVTSVDKTNDVFSTDAGFSYFYDANDIFQLWNGTACAPSTLAAFESVLSPSDVLRAGTIYGADPASQSTFCLEDAAPAEPAFTPASNTPTTVTLSITESATPTTDSYNVYRVVRPPSGVCPVFATSPASYTLIGSVADTNAGSATFTDTGLTPNTFYCYVVTAVDDGDQSTGTAQQQLTAATNETVRPGSTDAEVTTNGGFTDRLDAGDVIKICFNEAMKAPDAGDAIQVNDGTDVGTITNGSGATFALGTAATTDVGSPGTSCPAANTLVITLTANPVDTNLATGDNIFQLSGPILVTDSSGVTDLAGNSWDLANPPSTDRTIDVEAGVEPT